MSYLDSQIINHTENLINNADFAKFAAITEDFDFTQFWFLIVIQTNAMLSDQFHKPQTLQESS